MQDTMKRTPAPPRIQVERKNDMKFRICYTPVENTIAAKGATGVDESAFKCGDPKENVWFRLPDANGDTSLLQAWRRECRMLNILRPTLHHWVDTDVR